MRQVIREKTKEVIQVFDVTFSIEAIAKSESKSNDWEAKKLSTEASGNIHKFGGTNWNMGPPKRGGFGRFPWFQLDSEGLHVRKNNGWEIDKPLLELKSSFESAYFLTGLKRSASSPVDGQKQKETISNKITLPRV